MKIPRQIFGFLLNRPKGRVLVVASGIMIHGLFPFGLPPAFSPVCFGRKFGQRR